MTTDECVVDMCLLAVLYLGCEHISRNLKLFAVDPRKVESHLLSSVISSV